MPRSRVDLVLHGGTVVIPGDARRLDIAVNGETIAAVGAAEAMPAARQVIDVRGKIVLPGLIDAHAHPVRRAQRGDDGAADVQRGRGQAQTAGVVDGAGAGGEPSEVAFMTGMPTRGAPHGGVYRDCRLRRGRDGAALPLWYH